MSTHLDYTIKFIFILLIVSSTFAMAGTPTPTPSCTPSQLLTDGTFEAGTPWPAWTTQTSTNFDTPLCSVTLCGVGGGSAAPFSGSNWAWFGGIGDAETSTAGRSVVIPPGGPATLSFQMRIGAVNTPFTDVLRVRVDGNIIQTYTEPSVAEAGYSLRTINLSAFANGASHAILFEYIHTGTGLANFTVDDVSLVAGGCAAPVISGRVTYENAALPVVPVPSTSLNAPGTPSVTASSDASGNYMMSGFGAGAYTVTPTKPNVTFSAPNGIFSNDAALIARHVVGLITLNPTQLRAASVAGQPNVTSFDAGLIAQWIVGIPNAMNEAGKWKFTPTSRNYPTVVANHPNQNYAALLVGDVNGDWSPMTFDLKQPFRESAVLASVPLDMTAVTGTHLTVPFRLDGLAGREVSSYQFDVVYDPRVVEPAHLAASINGTNSDGSAVVANSPYPGLLKVVIYGPAPVTGDGVYVDLRFLVIGAIDTSSDLKIEGFRFNDGSDQVTTAGGRLTVLKQ